MSPVPRAPLRFTLGIGLLTGACSGVQQHLGPPQHGEPLGAGQEVRRVRVVIPDRLSGQTGALCADRCEDLVRVEQSYMRCLARCPEVTFTWDARCPRRATRSRCHEYTTLVASGAASQRASPRDLLVPAAVLTGVGTQVAIDSLCAAHSDDADCHRNDALASEVHE